jgi:Mn-dependent DtxR family transcriptional regulator
LLIDLFTALLLEVKVFKGESIMQDNISKSREDYLEAILIQIRKNGACRATDIANQLNFSKPSVSIALKKLEDEGFISRDDWRVLLTETGTKIAERTLFKHNFFEHLFEEMGIEKTTAEKEACQIEHIISDDSLSKIVDYVKNYNPDFFEKL